MGSQEKQNGGGPLEPASATEKADEVADEVATEVADKQSQVLLVDADPSHFPIDAVFVSNFPELIESLKYLLELADHVCVAPKLTKAPNVIQMPDDSVRFVYLRSIWLNMFSEIDSTLSAPTSARIPKEMLNNKVRLFRMVIRWMRNLLSRHPQLFTRDTCSFKNQLVGILGEYVAVKCIGAVIQSVPGMRISPSSPSLDAQGIDAVIRFRMVELLLQVKTFRTKNRKPDIQIFEDEHLKGVRALMKANTSSETLYAGAKIVVELADPEIEDNLRYLLAQTTNGAQSNASFPHLRSSILEIMRKTQKEHARRKKAEKRVVARKIRTHDEGQADVVEDEKSKLAHHRKTWKRRRNSKNKQRRK